MDADSPEALEAQAAYDSLKADPAIGVSDIEKAINRYCDGIGYRNFDEVVNAIAHANVGWKSSAKA